MSMLPFIVMRTILGAFTLAIISFLTFVIIQLPEGDYVDQYILMLRMEGDELSQEQADAIRDYYGTEPADARAVLVLDISYHLPS